MVVTNDGFAAVDPSMLRMRRLAAHPLPIEDSARNGKDVSSALGPDAKPTSASTSTRFGAICQLHKPILVRDHVLQIPLLLRHGSAEQSQAVA